MEDGKSVSWNSLKLVLVKTFQNSSIHLSETIIKVKVRSDICRSYSDSSDMDRSDRARSDSDNSDSDCSDSDNSYSDNTSHG